MGIRFSRHYKGEDNMRRNHIFGVLVIFLALLLSCNLLAGTGEPDIETPATAPPPSMPSVLNETPSLVITGQTYYLAPDTCNDNGNGQDDLPFCTFEVALGNLKPGDGLVLKPGFYTRRMEIRNLTGEAGAPIIIMGEAEDSVAFDGGCTEMPCDLNIVEWEWNEETGMISFVNSAHLILANLTVQNNIAAGVNVFDSRDITLQNLTIHDTGHVGILARTVEGLQIINNDVSRVTMGYRDESGDLQVGTHESISVLRSSDFIVEGNYIHDSPKEGIDIKESSADGEVRDNFVERMCHVGIYINEAFRVNVHDNRIRRSGYFLDGEQETLCSSYPNFGHLMGNYYGGGIQLAVGDLGDLSQGKLSDIQVHHNIIWNLYGNGIEFWDELRESHRGQGEMVNNLVANNVVYNVSRSALYLSDLSTSLIANNILALSEDTPIAGNALNQNRISHNLFFFGNGSQDISGESPLVADPMFVDPAGGGFSLQPESPAIDAGLDVGLPYTGAAPDIGAVEYGAAAMDPNSPVDIWRPAVGTTWQWQLTGLPVDQTFDVELYDIELFDNDANVVSALHTQGRKVICYISVGSWEDWRPDKDQFPLDLIGKDYEGWKGEKWLDIRQIDRLAPILQARFDQCKGKGFDAIEPDNIDGYTNDTGFSLTAEDQLRFNIWLAEEAHKRGLSIGLKNDPDQAAELEPYFDWALTEDCYAEDWCDLMFPFLEAGKAVFAAEYTDTGVTLDEMCPQAKELGFSLILKNRDLDAFLGICP